MTTPIKHSTEGVDEELRAIIQQQVADDPIKYLGENI